MPKCSIIIPVYGKASLTRRCLDTLLAEPSEHAGVLHQEELCVIIALASAERSNEQ